MTLLTSDVRLRYTDFWNQRILENFQLKNIEHFQCKWDWLGSYHCDEWQPYVSIDSLWRDFEMTYNIGIKKFTFVGLFRDVTRETCMVNRYVRYSVGDGLFMGKTRRMVSFHTEPLTPTPL